MTVSPTQAQDLPLDHAAFAAMQNAVIDAVPPRPGAGTAETQDQRAGALAFLAALRPGDPVQAMLAAHIVAAHYAAMACFQSAARDDLPPALHQRMVGKAVTLCRLLVATLRDLDRRQGGLAPRAVARPAAVPAARAQAVADQVVQASTPAQPKAPEGQHERQHEGRHERRRRERAERHLAAAARRVGPGGDARELAMQQLLLAEVAARAAAPAMGLAA
jgi:hypothetical protein